MKLDENILLKVGMSEHKRKDFQSFYYGAATSLEELSNKNIKDKETIYESFLKNGVYKKPKAIKTEIGREMTLFKNSIPLFEVVNDKMITLPLCDFINDDKNKKETVYWGMTYVELAIFKFIINQNDGQDIKKHPLIMAINLASEEKFSRKEISKMIHRSNLDKLKNLMNSEENLIELMKYGSGSPGIKRKDFEKSRWDLIEYLVTNINKKLDQEIFKNKLTTYYSEGLKIDNKNNRVINELLNGNYLEIIKKIKKDILIEETITFDGFIESYYEKSRSDYTSLIKSYLFDFLNIFEENNGVIIINPIYKEFVLSVEKEFNNLRKINFQLDLVKEFSNLIPNFKVTTSVSISYILKNEFSQQFFNSFFNSERKEWESILKHTFMKNVINGPTIYEFIIGVFFFRIFYYEEINRGDDLNDVFRNSINTKMNLSFEPLWFAPGGIEDALIVKGSNVLTIEPTLQDKRQLKMEFESSLDHLVKYENSNCFIISPTIESRLTEILLIHSNLHKEHKIYPLNNNSLLKINELENFSKVKYIQNIFNTEITINNLEKDMKDYCALYEKDVLN